VNKHVQNVEIDVLEVAEVLQSLVKFLIELREQFDLYEEKALSIFPKRKYMSVTKSVLFSGNFGQMRHVMVKFV